MNAGDVDESTNDVSIVTESNIDDVLSTVGLPVHNSAGFVEDDVNDDDNDGDPLCWSWMGGCAGRALNAFNSFTDTIETVFCGLVGDCWYVDATTSDEEVDVVDTAAARCERFTELAKMIPVRDLPTDEVVGQDSTEQITVDVARLPGEVSLVTKILREFVELYPNVGYNQVSLRFRMHCFLFFSC